MHPFGPEATSAPHPVYARLREEAPVHEIQLTPTFTAWLVTRYDDARRALNDPRLSKNIAGTPIRTGSGWPVELRAAMDSHMLSNDPPEHTRLRRLVSSVFTARRIAELRPDVQRISDELLDGFAGRDEVDLIGEYAFPLPLQVICELLGVPMDDRDTFRRWSNTIIASAMAQGDALAAATSMTAYVRELVERKRAEPDAALLSALVSAADEGDRLTEDELTSLVFLLLLAGHETTVNLIGNGVYLLLSHPEQLARLRADRTLLPPAIEEFLRYESPVKTSTFRIATEPVEFGGVAVPAGAIVMVSLLSANHDPQVFADPERFDPARNDNQHLAFGHGIHYCLGAPLARLEGEIAFSGLLDRFPKLRATQPLEELMWRPGALLRGLDRLPVTLS
ncbi:cytochrome P450 hydroxylase [Catellatospora methionotrophica]|uniref:Cytochrome P450 hydroxylase n=1 Tax=Catellatospora methionotrophica TaxID=121620 RepID=A0A8J3PJ24_9ACTN|nr:cytochrome P450 [Catellatospora methionotrophica]GIG16976.1 cytochrome P450 hydroxylase [Catellatospora methionotrophica]